MRKEKVFGLGVMLFCVVGAVVLFFMLYKPKEMRRDLERLKGDVYNGIFVSAFDTDYFDEDIFLTYRGVPVVIAEHRMRKAEDYADYFNAAWSSGNQITNIYMGVDPYALWKEAGSNREKWEELLDFYFIRYVEAHSDVTFEILLPFDSLPTWLTLDDSQRQERYDSYYSFVDKMDDYANVTQYYVGGQEWLIANPANYKEDSITAEVAKELMLLCFCDREYIVVSGNAGRLLGELEELVCKELETPSVYVDLSEYAFVFMGDSIIATAKGSYSIPGVLSGLTGASCYNLAVGGTPASVDPVLDFSFPYMAEQFCAGENAELGSESDFSVGLNEYVQANENKKLVFVLNFGLNDYFSGYSVDNGEPEDLSTYAGALRRGITTLNTKYPGASIIVQTPTYTNYFSEGKDILCEDGTGCVLEDYVDATIRVAEETNVHLLDNYYEFEMDGSNYEIYLSDGCHPNNYGRYVLGRRLAEFAGSLLGTDIK